jgi:hypothetical protein
MMHTKKIVLAEEENAGAISEGDKTLPEPPAPSSSYNRMDTEMRDILQNSKLSEFDKWVLYQEVLQRYLKKLEIHKKARVERRLIKARQQQRDIEPNSVEVKKNESSSVTDALKELGAGAGDVMRARLLVGLLEKSSCFEWDAAGRVTIMGTPTGASVKEYIEASMKRRPTTTPAGWNLYVTALKSLNIPPVYVANNALQEALRAKAPASPVQLCTGSTTAKDLVHKHDRPLKTFRWSPF